MKKEQGQNEQTLSEADRKNLESSLSSLQNPIYFNNAIEYLRDTEEKRLIDKIVGAYIKYVTEDIRNASKNLENNSSEEILRFIRSHITHEPFHLYTMARTLGISDRPYFISLAKLLAKAYELSEDSYFNASRIYKYLGDNEKSEMLLTLALSEQEQGIETKDSEKVIKLVERKSEFIGVLNNFFQEVDNDPAMLVDQYSVVEEAKVEIGNKLGLA